MSSKTIKITLVKSPIGRLKKHKACLRGLGLRRMGQTVELEDTPSINGMVRKVSYMVRTEAVSYTHLTLPTTPYV